MRRFIVSSVAFLAMTAVIDAQSATTVVGREFDGSSGAGGQGVAGGQCPTFVVFTAPDGCSTCACSVDARMTDCTRSACADPGNYTINECVENALYVGSDGCNRCQCNAFRSFSWCTRDICLLSDASPPQPVLAATRSPRPSSPSQRPPSTRSSPLRPSRPPPRRTASPTYTPDYAPSSDSPAPTGAPQPPRRRGWTRRPSGASTTRDAQGSTRGWD